MSETNAQEPTMEEILASIRKIISEDDPPSEAAAPKAAAPAAAAPPSAAEPRAAAAPPRAEPPAPEPADAHDDDVLELTDAMQPEPAPPAGAVSEPAPAAHTFQETLGDLDVFSTAAAAPPPAFTPAAPAYSAEPLVGSYASEATAGHFGALARSVSMPKEGRSLEDVVREMLKPMLRDWLDQHLPSIVEARVQAEVERIARRHDY